MAGYDSVSTRKCVTKAMYVSLRVSIFILCMYPRYPSYKQQDLDLLHYISEVSLVIQNKVKPGNVNTEQLCKQNNLWMNEQISANGNSLTTLG